MSDQNNNGFEFVYDPDTDGIMLVKCISDSETVVIPQEYDGKPVTVIGPYCFIDVIDKSMVSKEIFVPECDNTSLKKLILPDNLLEIRYCAFMHCTSLKEIIIPENVQYIGPSAFLNCYSLSGIKFPERCRMASNGLLFREDVIDTSYVEQIYIIPRNYLFQMNKLSDERSLEDQKKEKSSTPLLTIDVIEEGTPDFDVQRMLQNEQGRVNKSMMTDQELCRLIDGFYVPWIKKDPAASSPYACSMRELGMLFETISRDMYRFRNARTQDRRTLMGQAALCGKTASEAQLRRCLVLPRLHAE